MENKAGRTRRLVFIYHSHLMTVCGTLGLQSFNPPGSEGVLGHWRIFLHALTFVFFH